jgi:hypothetical protein
LASRWPARTADHFPGAEAVFDAMRYSRPIERIAHVAFRQRPANAKPLVTAGLALLQRLVTNVETFQLWRRCAS